MDQTLVSVCHPPQNKHIDIKMLQIVMSGLLYKDADIAQNSCSSTSFSHLFCPGSFSGTTTDTSIIQPPMEP